jgi:hypothetical protein
MSFFVTSFVVAYPTVLATEAASSKHEPVHSVTGNNSPISYSPSTSQQQFLPFSAICHKQLWLYTGGADGYQYDVVFCWGVKGCGADGSDKTAA